MDWTEAVESVMSARNVRQGAAKWSVSTHPEVPPMHHRVSLLALALCAVAVSAAEPLRSGPQVGDEVTPFEPLNLTGRFAGENRCLV